MNGQGQILAELLAKRCPDIQVLHDRRMPHSKANIDHQTKLVDGLARQVAVVEATLGGTLRDGDQGVLFMGDNNTTRPKQR